MPTNAINDTGVKYLYDKLHGEIEPITKAVSDSEVTIEGNPLNFNTLSSQNAKSTILSVEPIQDLHGYDKPWVGGAGKNKLYIEPATKDTGSGVIYESKADGSVKVTGTLTIQNYGWKCVDSWNLKAGTYKLNGGSRADGPLIYLTNTLDTLIASTRYGDKEFTLEANTDVRLYIFVYNDVSYNDTIYPMLRLSTETDPTFEPYENICPISGHDQIDILGCGKNLFNKNDSSSILNAYIGGVITANDNTRTVFIKCEPSTTYTVSKTAGQRFTVAYTKELPADGIAMYGSINNNTTSSITITTGADAKYIVAYVFNSSNDSGTAEQMLTSVQIEKNNQATDYSPYQESNNLSIDLPSTVYGGVLDLESGELVVDRVYNNITSVDYYGTYGVDNAPLFFKEISEYIKGYDTDITAKPISNLYNAVPYSQAEVMKNGEIRTQVANSTKRLYFRDDRFNSKAEIDAWLSNNPLEIVGTLSIPITIELTPHQIALLKGVNNISTDGDKITLTYRDGSVATLGDLTSAVDNLDSKIDESKILTDTVTGDKYILVVTNGVLSVQQISN